MAFTPVAPAANAVLRAADAETKQDRRSRLFVANFAHSPKGRYEVNVFDPDDPSKGLVEQISDGVFEPDGVYVDSQGNLYVTNGRMSGDDSVDIYAKGKQKPKRILSGSFCTRDVVAGSDGTVYVADGCGGPRTLGRVLVYASGTTKPSRSFYPGGAPYCLTLDAANNLYVGYNSHGSYAGQVKRYAPGAKKGVNLIPNNFVHFLTGVAVDQHGALLVANEVGGAIDVFTAKGKPPSRVIHTGQAHPFAFTFDRHENKMYVSDPCFGSGGRVVPSSSSACSGGGRPNTVVALDYPSGKRLWTLRAKNLTPMGVAIRPNPPF